MAKSKTSMSQGAELNTMLGEGSTIDGDVSISKSLRVDGKINGNVISTDTVILGQGGRVEGSIREKHIMLAGQVKGNVSAEGKICMEGSAKVNGDIKAARLIVDEGAQFDGNCAMNDGKNSVLLKREKKKG